MTITKISLHHQPLPNPLFQAEHLKRGCTFALRFSLNFFSELLKVVSRLYLGFLLFKTPTVKALLRPPPLSLSLSLSLQLLSPLFVFCNKPLPLSNTPPPLFGVTSCGPNVFFFFNKNGIRYTMGSWVHSLQIQFFIKPPSLISPPLMRPEIK